MPIKKATPWYVLNSPELGGAFEEFATQCNENGVLDKATKELLMIALASVFRCPHCTETHIKRALEIGVSKEEITETLLIAALEGAGTQLAWAKDIYKEHLTGKAKQV